MKNIAARRSFGICKHSLHFIINDTVIRKIAGRLIYLIMPPFLSKRKWTSQDVRIEHSVKIYVRKIQEILIIARRKRIVSSIPARHSIHEYTQ